jgi:hypothetical protein
LEVVPSYPRQVGGQGEPFVRNMAAQEFLIIGTSGIIVASMIVWLVWLRRYVE